MATTNVIQSNADILKAAQARFKANSSSVPAPQVPSTSTTYKPTTSVSTPVPSVVSIPAPKATTTTVAKPTYREEAVTNYGGKYDPYNEILNSKKEYDAGNKGWASNNATQYYNQLDSAEATKVKGMDTQQLIDYINSRNQVQSAPSYSGGGAVPAPSGASPYASFVAPENTQQVPIYNPALPVRDEAALRAYAEAQVKKKLEELGLSSQQQIRAGETTANQQLGSIQTQYDRFKQTEGEDRALEDTSNARNLSPFSGRSDYALGMVNQQRGRTDRESSQDLSSRQANVTQDLANLKNTINEKYAQLQNAAPDEAEALFQSILNDERQYDLAINGQQIQGLLANSQLNTADFEKALATYNTNRSNFESDRQFGLQEGSLTGNYNGSSTLAGKQANWNSYMDMVGQTGNLGTGPTNTWGNLPKNAYAGEDTLAGKQFANQEQQQLFQNSQAIQQFEEDKRRYGQSYAMSKNSQLLQEDSNLRQWIQMYSDMSNPTSSGSSGGLTANQVLGSMQSLYTEPVYRTDEDGVQQKSGTKITSDPAKREQMFLGVVDSNMSDTETNQILNSLGFTKAEIESYTKKYGGTSGN